MLSSNAKHEGGLCPLESFLRSISRQTSFDFSKIFSVVLASLNLSQRLECCWSTHWILDFYYLNYGQPAFDDDRVGIIVVSMGLLANFAMEL